MGSSGGGSSGSVSLPGYLQWIHALSLSEGWSSSIPSVVPGTHMVDLINANVGNSPYSSMTAYSPDTRTGNITTAASTFKAAADALAYGTDFPLFFISAAAELSSTSHLEDMETAIGAYDEDVEGMSPKTDWEALLASVVAKVVSTVVPQLHLSSKETQLGYLDTLLDGVVHTTDVKAMISDAAAQIDTSIAPDAYFTAQAAAAGTILGDDIDNEITPRFQAGMRDLNSVMNSAYVIGLANINARKTDQIARITADLQTAAYMKRAEIISAAVVEMTKLYLGTIGGRADQARVGNEVYATHDKNLIDCITAGVVDEVRLTLGRLSAKADSAKLSLLAYTTVEGQANKDLLALVGLIAQYHLQQVDFKRHAANMTMEGQKLALIAEKEEWDAERDIDIHDATWDFDCFVYLSNFIAGVQGGVFVPNEPKRNAMGTALGGALMGTAGGAAAIGMAGGWGAAATSMAAVGGPWGALAVGAALGIGAAFTMF